MDFVSTLLAAIGTLAIGWYLWCLIYLGFVSPQPPATGGDALREFMATSLATLAGTLATFVGMVLGIRSAAREPETNAIAAVLGTGTSPVSGFQVAAGIAYVLSLLIALVAWFWNRKNPDPAIVALGKSFLGLIGGALAVILNVNVPQIPPKPQTPPAQSTNTNVEGLNKSADPSSTLPRRRLG